jgi:hypothetical protein
LYAADALKAPNAGAVEMWAAANAAPPSIELAATSSPMAGECKFGLQPEVNMDGTNLPRQPVSANCTTVDQCAAFCCSTPGCKAFTLNSARREGERDCYLKAVISHRHNPGAMSGIVNAEVHLRGRDHY